MAKDSVHKKIEKDRKPRVHISYDVEVGGALENKQIPFVVGVMADLSGNSKARPELKHRKFVEIDRDHFEDVVKGVRPRLEYKVPNELKKDGTSIGIELEFESMADFTPERIAERVKPIRDLVEARRKLNELALKVNANAELDGLLQKVVTNTDTLKGLKEAVGGDTKEGAKGEDTNG